MTEPQLEELISAYLDGELTAAEQTRIERLLESDAAARSLADELRALSSTLQALPQHRLAEDLSASVLAQVRTAADNGSTPGGHSIAAVPHDDQRLSPASDGRSSRGSASAWRGLIWAAMAIAASIVIVLFNADQPAPELAKNERTAGDVEMLEADADDAGERFAMSASEAATAGDAEKSQPASDEMRRSSAAMKSRAAKSLAVEEIEEQVASPKLADAESMPEQNTVRGGAGANIVAGKAGAAPMTARSQLEAKQPATSALQAEQSVQAAVAADRAELAIERLSEFNGALFVQVNIKESAARSGAFSKLLATENIVWEDEDSAHSNRNRELKKQDRQNASVPAAPLADRVAADQGNKAADGKTATGEPIEVVVVEASPEQIERTLTRIRSTPGKYAGYDVAPSDSPEVQQLAESYDFVAPADVAQSRLEATADGPSAANDPLVADAAEEEKPAEALARDKRKTESTRATKKEKAEHATKDAAARSDDDVVQRKLAQDDAALPEGRATATRYFIQSQDLPVQAQSRSVVQGNLSFGAAVQSQRPATAQNLRSFHRNSKQPRPATVAESPAPPAAAAQAAPEPASELVQDSLAARRATVLQAAPAQQAVARQSRAYFVLRVVPDTAAEPGAELGEAAIPAESALPAAEPVEEKQTEAPAIPADAPPEP